MKPFGTSAGAFAALLAFFDERGWGPSVTSWLRSQEHNAKVGGVPNSAHRYGRAIDVVWDNQPSIELVERCLAAFNTTVEIHFTRETTHDHFELRF
jgi:hypothetical protein